MSQLTNHGAHPLPSDGNNTDYLGDGAYAQFDGHDLLIYASDGMFHSRPVYLNHYAAQALIQYARRSYGPTIIPNDLILTHENEQSEIISPETQNSRELSADSITHDAPYPATDYDILTDLDIGPELDIPIVGDNKGVTRKGG